MKVLVPVEGSESSSRAVDHLIKKLALFKSRDSVEIHLINVQHEVPYGNRVSSVVGHDKLAQYHREEGMKALKPAMQKLESAGVPHQHHVAVGDAADVICRYAKEKGMDQIVMGTRGMGSVSNLVLGSVATKVIHLSAVPVLLVK